jgi:bifunctional non-homologous end joining protein LigD
MTKMTFGPYAFETSNEDKVFFPDSKITKGDVIVYYDKIAEFMLPYLESRPLNLHRFPDGIDAEGFFQQQAGNYFPDWIPRITIPKQDGNIMHPTADKKAVLVYLANQAVITFHAWLSRNDKIQTPDQIVFDLDPPPDAGFEVVRTTALEIKDLLDALGLAAFVKTSGSKGLHVVCPVRRGARFDKTRKFAGDVARYLAAKKPDRITIEQRKHQRRGRLFLDTVRNSYGHTMVVPYSLRALPGAPVATPIDWQEVRQKSLTPDRYTLSNIFRRLARKKDPWKGMNRQAKDLSGPQQKLKTFLSETGK